MRRSADLNPFDRESYRAHLVLAVLSLVIHGGLLFYDWTHQRINLPALYIGSVGSAVLVVVLAFRLVPLRILGPLVAYLTQVWLAVAALLVVVWHQPMPEQYWVLIGAVVLLTFTWLPLRQAWWLTGAQLAVMLFIVLTYLPGHVPMLLYVVLLVGLIAFLTLFGQRTNTVLARQAWLQELAFTDPLTGVMNRRGAWEALVGVMESAASVPGAVILLDIDQFKGINDQFGHAVGDSVLIQVARSVAGVLPAGAVLSRWGGEEFLLVCGGATLHEARALAQRVVEAVRGTPGPSGVVVTVSVGLALVSEALNRDALVDLADRRMYQAKQLGGNRWA